MEMKMLEILLQKMKLRFSDAFFSISEALREFLIQTQPYKLGVRVATFSRARSIDGGFW